MPAGINALTVRAFRATSGITDFAAPYDFDMDLSARVRRFSVRRGRNSLLDRVEAGNATLELIDDDGSLDPDAAGVDWEPGGHISIKVKGAPAGTLTEVFHGFIERIDHVPAITRAGAVGNVTVRAADGFKIWSLSKITTSYGSELSSTRISALSVYINSSGNDIDTGLTTVQASTLSQSSALEHAQLVAQSEGGVVFMKRTGVVGFRNRANAYSNTGALVCTFADTGAGGTIKYAELQKVYTDDELYTRVEITREGGVVQVAEDINAQNLHGLRVLAQSGLLMTTTQEALDKANYLLARYKEPKTRVRGLTVFPAANATFWDTLLALEIGNRVDVIRTLVAGASPATKTHACIVQGIDHDYDASSGEYRIFVRLDDVTGETAWILGDSVFGVMDSTTILGY